MKVLLLGGTGEAREVARLLADEHEVVSSLAGRVKDPKLPVGQVRHGGFGGVEGLAAYLRAERVDALVDATHPFAATMTAHAAQAAREVGVPLLLVRRPGWTPQPSDTWHWVDDLAEAAQALPGVGTRAFVTTGRQGLAAFAAAEGRVWMLARCVEPPEPVPAWCELILARGPYSLQDELNLLQEHRIDVLVTKDSGGGMTAAKLEAARALGIPVVVVRRPSVPEDVELVTEPAQVVEWLQGRR
ncbi:cobalt-precorrin-6A reductase [Kribbella deserti]|uniref:Cobalt-precorrin-6A reductase n=1 Tax=Kribbella deserti TaxID=1926257 RepID=A0ABV6QQS2_9ACTN